MKKLYFFLFLLVGLAACKKDKGPTVLFEDGLTNNTNSWLLNSGSYYTRSFTGSQYVMELDTANWYLFTASPYADPINFPYEVQFDASLEIGGSGNSGSIIVPFNVIDDNNLCIAQVNNFGQFRVLKLMSGSSYSITATKTSDAIKTDGSVNNFRIVQESNIVTFYINGTRVSSDNSVIPNAYLKAGVGVVTEQEPYFGKVTGRFSNFAIRKL